MRRFRLLVFALLMCLSVAVTAAQDANCPALVRAALEATNQACSSTQGNQACYGNVTLQVVPRAGAPAFVFQQRGDLVDVSYVQSLRLSAMDTVLQQWGVALMKLQANLPGTTPGQNITFVLFGDVVVSSPTSPPGEPPLVNIMATDLTSVRATPANEAMVIGSLAAGQSVIADARLADNTWLRFRLPDGGRAWVYTPLVTPGGDINTLQVISAADAAAGAGVFAPRYGLTEVFYFQSGIGDAPCAEAPDSGILIQTPAGAGQISLQINQVDIQLASTIYVQAQPGGYMTVSTLEGVATVTSSGSTVVVTAGFQTRVPLNASLEAAGPPSTTQPYDGARIAVLPVSLLPQTVAPPVAVVPTSPPLVTEEVVPSVTPVFTLTPTQTAALPPSPTQVSIVPTSTVDVQAGVVPISGVWREPYDVYDENVSEQCFYDRLSVVGGGCGSPEECGIPQDEQGYYIDSDLCASDDGSIVRLVRGQSFTGLHYRTEPSLYTSASLDELGDITIQTSLIRVLAPDRIQVTERRTARNGCTLTTTKTLTLRTPDPMLTCQREGQNRLFPQPADGEYRARWAPIIGLGPTCDASLASSLPNLSTVTLALADSGRSLLVGYDGSTFTARASREYVASYTYTQTFADNTTLNHTLGFESNNEVVGMWSLVSGDGSRTCSGLSLMALAGSEAAARIEADAQAQMIAGQIAFGEEFLFTFDAQAGETVTIALREITEFGGEFRMDLLDPAGNVLMQQTPLVEGLTLPAAGTYSVKVTSKQLGGLFILSLTRGVTASTVQKEVTRVDLSAVPDYVYSQPFEAQTGEIITITARNISEFFSDAALLLRDPSGRIIALNNDYFLDTGTFEDDPLLEFRDARIENFIIPTAGTYTIQVMNGSGFTDGLFELTLARSGPFSTSGSGSAVFVPGAIAPDTRYQYTFAGEAGDVVSLLAQDISGGYNAKIALLDASGQELASRDDSRLHAARIENFTLPASEAYTVELRQNFGSRKPEFFELTITSTGQLTPVSSGLTDDSGARIFILSDVMLLGKETRYTFDTGTSGTITAITQIAFPDQGPNPSMSLLDSSGAVLARNDDHLTDDPNLAVTDSVIQNVAIPAAGTYTLQVVDTLGGYLGVNTVTVKIYAESAPVPTPSARFQGEVYQVEWSDPGADCPTALRDTLPTFTQAKLTQVDENAILMEADGQSYALIKYGPGLYQYLVAQGEVMVYQLTLFVQSGNVFDLSLQVNDAAAIDQRCFVSATMTAPES